MPSASELLAEAELLLEEANEKVLPQSRHAHRNRAAAVAIGLAIPARPHDVYTNHIFGKGIFFEESSGCYRFCYHPQKTRLRGEQLNLVLDPHWNQFIDAMILQDQDPAYLYELRQKVIDEQRPLYVNYDRSPCGPSWYSNAWRAVVGTGGQIARTMIYDEMAEYGEFGIQFGQLVCNHKSYKTADKYRSEKAIQKSCRQASTIMATSAKQDDISDLLI